MWTGHLEAVWGIRCVICGLTLNTAEAEVNVSLDGQFASQRFSALAAPEDHWCSLQDTPGQMGCSLGTGLRCLCKSQIKKPSLSQRSSDFNVHIDRVRILLT